MKIESLIFWAPAATVDLFKEYCIDPIMDKRVKRFAMFILKHRTENDDDCAGIYNKSLLYLVSNAFEDKPRIPIFRDGIPLIGMQKFVDPDGSKSKVDPKIRAMVKNGYVDLIMSPNEDVVGLNSAARSKKHGDFDNDNATLLATLARILNKTKVGGEIVSHPTSGEQKSKRMNIERQAS